MIDYRKIKQALTFEDRSELCTLFENHALSDLTSNIELLKEEHSSDTLIKILWNYCLLDADTLPLSFIASAMLDMVQHEEILNKHPKISFLVCKDIFYKLIEEKELRSAIYLIKDFILKSNPVFFDSENEFNTLQRDVINSIDKESQEAIKRRENTVYINSLTQLLSQIKETKAPKIALSHHTPDISTIKDTEEFTLGTATNTEELPFERTTKDIIPILTSSKKQPLIPKLVFYVLVLCIFSSITYALYPRLGGFLKLYSLDKNSTENIIFESSLDEEILVPQRNVPKAFSLDSLGANLDDINKRLAKLGSQKEVVKNEESKNQNTTHKPIDYSEVESLNTVPDSSTSETPQAAPSPTESQAAPIPKLPSTPSNIGTPVDLGNTQQSGSRAQGTTLDPNKIKKSPDGRAYGPPEIQDPTKGKNPQRALDGSALQSYEVERYDPPLVYETITATNVLAAPSLMSQTITRLVSATPIHVTAKMGLWLELRSNEGKIGYIFTQDAVQKK